MPKVKPRSRKNRRSKSKRSSGFFSELRERIAGFSIAAAAGCVAVSALVLSVLWFGGYIGLLNEQAGRAARTAAINAGFDIKRVTAMGYQETSQAELMRALGPVVGASLAHFDVHAARARVEGLGWVRSAAVSRLWPNTIHISVREREPAAVWQLAGELHLIDQGGVVIRKVDAHEFSSLPLIVGAGAPETVTDVLQALRTEPSLWGEAAALVRVGERRWNMRTQSGGDIKFPEDGVEAAVKTLARLQAAYGLLDRPIEYVDLRDPTRLVYRERKPGEQAKELEIR